MPEAGEFSLRPKDATPRPERLPLAGRIVAYGFLALGFSSVADTVVGLLLQDRLDINFAAPCGVWVGWALLRGRQTAPGCGGAMLFLALASIVFFVGMVALQYGNHWLGGPPPQEIRFRPSAGIAIPFIVVGTALTAWAWTVLKRPGVRRYCDGSAWKQTSVQFRIEHLLVAMVIVASCLASLTMDRHQVDRPSQFQVISSPVTADGRLVTMIAVRLESDDGVLDDVIKVVWFLGDPGQSIASRLYEGPTTWHLQIGKETYDLDPEMNVHALVNGELTEADLDLTLEGWERFQRSDPTEWSIDELRASLESGALKGRPSDSPGQRPGS